MDRRLYQYYNRELQHLRDMSGEFAREFPKIAGRLSLDEFSCADPYVERLLEGFAFLAARVHLKMDAEFPRFTNGILDTVYPHYLAPTPSMCVVQFRPQMSQGSLTEGFRVPRGVSLRSVIGPGDRTPCDYQTAHDVMLWPIRVTEATYHTQDMHAVLELPSSVKAAAAIRIRVEAAEGQALAELGFDRLTFFLRGQDDLTMRIYEQIFGHGEAVVVQSAARPPAWQELAPGTPIRRVGFADDEALFPFGARSFQGYRLLHEYFAFPQRYLFFELGGLAQGTARCEASAMDLVILLREPDLELEGRLDASNFALFCTPTINLFEKRTDRIHLSDRFAEYHVMPDRTRPLDFEVYQVKQLEGHGMRVDQMQLFQPFYASMDNAADRATGAYYTSNRVPRAPTNIEVRHGRRSSYAGSEVFLSLVDGAAAPFRSDLRELAVTALCTNRDLPLQMPLGGGRTDFTMEISAPLETVRCVSGPTPPRPSRAEGETSWRAVSHLSLNYLSLVDAGDGQGTAALREILRLYADLSDPQVGKQIDAVKSVESHAIARRVSTPGPITFARGIEITATLDETAFGGAGAFLFGAVLEHFFAKHVTINSFTETVVKTTERGEIMRWPTRLGVKRML